MELAVLAIPLGAALLAFLARQKWHLHLINITAAVLLVTASYALTAIVMQNGHLNFPFLKHLFYLDSLSILVLDTIVTVAFMASIFTVGYINTEFERGILNLRKIRIYYILYFAFVFTMILVVTTQSLGVMWIAIEATTLSSVFLVGFYNNRYSLEAAWKYIIICSVGIAFAMLGILFLHLASLPLNPSPENQLNWEFLSQNAAQLSGNVLKIAFIFVLMGFGAKVGLVPLHTWLPDAHSQAPSPVSALLSGVLLNSAMYGIIRVLVVVNKNLGDATYTGRLLIAAGILSVGAAALFILPQRDYKRLLAYSSIEHMGIISFGLGVFTPAAIFAALFHMLNHAFTKSMLFLASGNIYLKYETREISKVRGVLNVLPMTGTVFLLGLFAITGLPPFSIFASELGILVSSYAAGRVIPGTALLFLLALVFAGAAASLLSVFFGPEENEKVLPGELNRAGTAVLALMLFVILLTGIYLPEPIRMLIAAAGKIIAGGN